MWLDLTDNYTFLHRKHLLVCMAMVSIFTYGILNWWGCKFDWNVVYLNTFVSLILHIYLLFNVKFATVTQYFVQFFVFVLIIWVSFYLSIIINLSICTWVTTQNNITVTPKKTGSVKKQTVWCLCKLIFIVCWNEQEQLAAWKMEKNYNP